MKVTSSSLLAPSGSSGGGGGLGGGSGLGGGGLGGAGSGLGGGEGGGVGGGTGGGGVGVGVDGGVGGGDGGGDTDLSMAMMSGLSSTVTPRAAEVAWAEPKEVTAVPATEAAAEEFSTLIVKTRLTLAAVMVSETSDGATFSVVAMVAMSVACAPSP